MIDHVKNTAFADLFEDLVKFDPELAESMINKLSLRQELIRPSDIRLCIDQILWAMSQEISFGYAISNGLTELIGLIGPDFLSQYIHHLQTASQSGPTLAKLLAIHLTPVILQQNQTLIDEFFDVVETILDKGTYALDPCLVTLSELLFEKDHNAAQKYMALLKTTFAQEMSYNQCQHISLLLPKAVQSFPSNKRGFQIEQLTRIVQIDFKLAAQLCDGYSKGLISLSPKGLEHFITQAISKFDQNPDAGQKFLALDSRLANDTFLSLQISIPYDRVKSRISRYAQARIGTSISVYPLSKLQKGLLDGDVEQVQSCTDGKSIFVPDEIDVFPNKQENLQLYRILAKFQLGFIEFGTYHFDLEKLYDRLTQINLPLDVAMPFIKPRADTMTGAQDLSEFDLFFKKFEIPVLAADLFNIFEQGRIRLRIKLTYPTLGRHLSAVFRKQALSLYDSNRITLPILILYFAVALDSADQIPRQDRHLLHKIEYAVKKFNQAIHTGSSVQDSALLVCQTYKTMENILSAFYGQSISDAAYQSIPFPFNGKLQTRLFYYAHQDLEKQTQSIWSDLKKTGISIYKAEIRNKLQQSGRLTPDDILKDAKPVRDDNHLKPSSAIRHDSDSEKASVLAILEKHFGQNYLDNQDMENVQGTVTWYKEWSAAISDYINDHVRVCDRHPIESDSNFYEQTLIRHKGLVKRIRYAFELIKPERLDILRQWVEGDAFDYRALIDYAVDRKAGLMPSERLYIKRIKRLRDVSVLLLVDQSRSTTNVVYGSDQSVLDVEKEAIVLLCEALEVIGDQFAIAGFSGTGRLGVDYYKIKDFEDRFNQDTKQKISAMRPQRNTRMGAAIRHASFALTQVPAKIKLLIILGDGFPNDVDYKQVYASEDTRKAILEARAKNIHVHAITVNMASDAKLDDLYGNVHHNVISDVRDLPDKLIRIYRDLTR